jgi:subtilisin family serine protease
LRAYGRKPGTLRMRRFLVLASLLAAWASAADAASHAGNGKLDSELRQRAGAPRGRSRVIVRLDPGASADAAIRGLRGIVGRRLASISGQVADIPDSALDALAQAPGVEGISLDRRVQGTLERTGATIGAGYVHDALGFDGTGVGVAIIDSGVVAWHDDLESDRVARFVDFVSFQPSPYDDYGHGTHVAGIIAGSGYDSGGRRRGIAPGATLLVEKVLDAAGQGYISNVIAAIDYAIANRQALNLRVINLSVAAGVYESYTTDPLTLAARRAVEAGLVVVTAAGNLGRKASGEPQYGGIGAPGNAPWVITVGASSHNGTADRSDDTVAGFSSRGPGAIDFQAKPDLVAPGVGIESLADAGTTLYNTKPLMRLWGTVPTATEPYLSLSGSSMAAPVVSGTIALMLQANPALTPNLVKAVLEFTAEARPEYDGLTQGAGFLNARGAVELAQSLATGMRTLPSASADPTPWSAHVTWGNHRIGGGRLEASGSAWRTDVMWGSALTPDGRRVVWGTAGESGNVVWDTGTSESDNIVWGTACGGADCDPSPLLGAGSSTWRGATETNDIVWGASTLDEADDIVWAPVIRRQSRIALLSLPQK